MQTELEKLLLPAVNLSMPPSAARDLWMMRGRAIMYVMGKTTRLLFSQHTISDNTLDWKSVLIRSQTFSDNIHTCTCTCICVPPAGPNDCKSRSKYASTELELAA